VPAPPDPLPVRLPAPLRPGDVIGVTAPSSGVPDVLRPRLDAGVAWLRARGFELRLGECLGADRVVSAPRRQRADELMAMLRDPAVRAVVPPWGGELAIDLVGLLDYDELAGLDPTWVVGYSDISTLLVPLTLRAGWATLHGGSLMETPYAPPPGVRHWTEVASTDGAVHQQAPGVFRAEGLDDWVADPAIERLTLPDPGRWHLHGGGGLDVTGLLVGGCIEVLGPLAGTPYGDVAAFGEAHAGEGLVVYLEAAESGAYDICRALHGLRLAGWFEHASAVLVGRTSAPDAADLTQREAVLDALGDLDVPLVLDVEVGHVHPHFALVNGVPTRVVVDRGRQEVVQDLTRSTGGAS
jgi:muramoyltetrapeptide carboxypeptidase LdcA involved in peptidoglycan recycling